MSVENEELISSIIPFVSAMLVDESIKKIEMVNPFIADAKSEEYIVNEMARTDNIDISKSKDGVVILLDGGEGKLIKFSLDMKAAIKIAELVKPEILKKV